MSERVSIGIRLSKLRRLADEWNRVTLYPQEVLALVEAVEAARGAAILTYDPSKTTAQNDEYQRRARHLREKLARFDFDGAA